MQNKFRKLIFMSAVFALAAGSGRAEVTSQSAAGFTVAHEAVIAASAEDVWAAFIDPAGWWSSAHTWSGDAANLSLDAKAGGCWCERWEGGEVAHLTVVSARPGGAITLSGGLGPLLSMGVAGALTFALEPGEDGVKVTLRYAAGGHFDAPVDALAPAVDGVIGEQFSRLLARIGGE